MRAVARAPVRVDPAGGGTDAPPFCIDYGGAVVNFAVARHAFATAQRLPQGAGAVVYAADLGIGEVASSAAELRGNRLEFVTAFVRRLVPKGDSLLLLTETEAPPGSGLGGSGALGVAIVAAIDRAYGHQRSARDTAALANEIERQDLGYPGGSQDSYAAALGGVNLLEYRQGGGITPRPLDVSEETRLELEHRSLLIYTGAAHVSGAIHEDIKRSYALPNSPTVKAMVALRDQANSMAAALESGDLNSYAKSLNESCRQLYNLHESCNSADHRRFLQALDDCLLGGKTCGAGGGGFMLVLTRPGRRGECLRRVEQLGGVAWPMTIDRQGMASWMQADLSSDEIDRRRHLAESFA